jgi:hypothetical protein
MNHSNRNNLIRSQEIVMNNISPLVEVPRQSLRHFYRSALTVTALLALTACGGGGGSTETPTASTPAATTPVAAAPAAPVTPAAPPVTDASANAEAIKNMASTPVDVAVWSKLNEAGADVARSLVPTTTTVVISAFKTITDPTGGPDAIKVFDGILAHGSLDSNRVFQLSSGSLPSGSTKVWVNVIGEDFTKNNPDAESALETTVSSLSSALALPLQ